ncbi:MAG: hypothetical protein IJG33_15150 [Selenomonadaceae bacterium]|nr:hypothetical protein [Selenomonadaceae bacterium]
MDFATIGRLSTYVKQKNLTFAAKHKIRTGQTLTNANGNLISANLSSTFDKLREASKTATDQAKKQKLALIRRKLKAGQKLSDEELGFLRVNDPKTYKKAKAADEAREELKSELKSAKTKEEAREAMTRAMVKASSTAMAELSSIGAGGGNISGVGSSNLPQSAAMNVSGGEIANQSVSDGSTLTNANQTGFNPSNGAINGDDNKISAQKTEDADNLTPEDIMEKYLWTIRALEDEWAHFTNSSDYKDMPEHFADEKTIKKVRRQIYEPDRRILDAVTAYRRAMA